jgi:serine/threonine-protein kinase
MVKTDKIIGKHIDQFTVESFIAEGSMGMVFKAYDSMLARVVALKLIPKNSQNATDTEALHREEAQKRLKHEAQTAGNLVHPNIVTIHSYGETDEFQYICMEYIRGKTLSQILKERGAIPVEEAIPILEQILLAVVTADKAGIVHRDIKPSNIMITEDNRVKVMDFGIAKLPSLSLTVTGMVLGTPFYMSPEQISGRKVDIRSDIFSLGAVFYELVTGVKPFEAENTTTLIYKIVQTDPIPPNIVNVNIPQSVARVIFRAMAKDPSQRYQKPAEMLKDVKALASAAPTDSEAVIASQPSFDRTMLADQPQSGAPAIGHVSAPHSFPSEQQIYAVGPKGEAAHHPERAREDLLEAKKTRPDILPAIILLLLLVVCAGGAALWHFNRIGAQKAKPAVPQQAGGVEQVQPPATMPANTQSGAGQPQAPKPAVPQQAGGVEQVQPPATMPANTQSGAGQPQAPKPAVPQQAGGVEQVQPPATTPANTQSGAGQPQVPKQGPDTNQSQLCAAALPLESENQFLIDPHGAQKLMEEALTLNPNNYDCVLSLARLLVSRNDPLAAIRRYKQALSLNSSVAEVHYELGNIYMGQAEFDMAIQSFEASLRLKPRNRDEVLANIGTCYMKKGDLDKAKLSFKLSLDANPDNAGARSSMASLKATTTPSISHGAGGKPLQPWQFLFEQQTAPQQPAPIGKTPLKSSEIRLEGNYTLEGTKPNGARYSGTAGITQSDGRYSVTWKIAGQTYTGTGTLFGTTLTINRKGHGAVDGVVVYRMGANGKLNGIWGSGKGQETLKPVN